MAPEYPQNAKKSTRRTAPPQDLSRQMDALDAVFDLAELFAGGRDLDDILDKTAERVAKVMNAKACGIRVLREETGELVIRASYNLSDRYLNKGPVLVEENPIDAAAMKGETVYTAEAWTDSRVRYPEQAKAEGLVSGLCVPMIYRGQTVGVIRVYTSEPYRFTPVEEAVLRAAGSQAAAGIIYARLMEERRQTERFQRQIRYAGEIQRRMIPHKPPEHESIAFGCVYDACLDLGGDLYDFIQLADGKVAVVVADVVGKGVPAALLMASVRAALRAQAPNIDRIGRLISQVNRHLHRDTLVGEFATVFYGIFSADGRKMAYVNAGHDPPLLLRGGTFRPLDTGGTVIGVRPDARYQHEVIDLQPEDLLVLYTDGVVDAMNFDGQRFGPARLRASILKYRETPARTIANQILWDTRRFAGLAPQADDITIVVAKVS